MIPDSFITELKYASDVEQVIGAYVRLTRKGRNLTGLCPFHSEKTPSFTVYPETQSYYCFGCGNGGDVITFVRQAENLEYLDALQFLAQRSGLVVPQSGENKEVSRLRTRVLEINRESARFFHSSLLAEEGRNARAYLLGRGLTSKTIRTFGIGYAPDSWDSLRKYLKAKGYSESELFSAAVVSKGRGDSVYDLFRDRIIFPIIDLRGNIIGFGGRLLGERGPKYLNSPDTPVFKKSRNLYSLNFAKSARSDTLILGEGYMDVIAMYQAGFENSVATLGTSLTSEQSRLIAQYARKVIIAYDSDNAGQSAAKRAINLFGETNVGVTVLQLEGAKDPDEYIKKFGAARFQNLLEDGKAAMDFEIDKLRQSYNLTLNDDKVAFLGDFCRLMAGVNHSLQREVYIGQIAGELGIGKESILSTVESIRKKKFGSQFRQESRKLSTSISESAGTESKRYRKNIEGLVAEEQLLTMLLRNPDYYDQLAGKLTPEDFSDQGYRQIYQIMVERLEDNLPLDLIHFSSQLSNPLMAQLSGLLLKGQELTFYPEQAKEYLGAIKAEQQRKNPKQVAEMTPEEYKSFLNDLRSDKQ